MNNIYIYIFKWKITYFKCLGFNASSQNSFLLSFFCSFMVD